MKTHRVGVRLSLYVKLAAAFVIVMLPLILGYILVFNQGYQMAYQRTVAAIDSRQEYLVRTLDNELTSIYRKQIDFSLDEDILYLVHMYDSLSDYQRYQQMSQIHQKINIILPGTESIAQISVVIPPLHRIISTNDGITMISEDFSLPWDYNSKGFTYFQMYNGNFSVISQMNNKSGGASYLCIAELSNDYIGNVLDSFSGIPVSSILYYEDPVSPLFVTPGTALPAAEAMVPEQSGSLQPVRLDDGEYYARRDTLFFGNLTLISLVDQSSAFDELQGYAESFMMMLAISLIILVLFIIYFIKTFNLPFIRLSEAFIQLRDGDFEVDIPYVSKDDFAEMYSHFNYMVEQMRRHVRDRYEQQLLLKQANMRLLQAQVDPHFLNNSFLSIASMAELEDYDGIRMMAEKLSQYYEYTTRLGINVVRMENEYRFACMYAEIQHIRFGARLEFRIASLPEECHDIVMPRFILQTLIENAYKHGAGAREAGGVISLRVERKNDVCIVLVEDNGIHMNAQRLEQMRSLISESQEDAGEETGVGLVNASRRLRLFYNNDSRMELEQSLLGGLLVRIIINIPKGEDACTGC